MFRTVVGALLAVLGTAVGAAAQAPEGSARPRFDHLGLEQGLSQSVVRTVFQDRRGFVWIGTEDGLNLFDGYRVTTLDHDPDNNNSLPSSAISGLAETTGPAGATLWIGTTRGLAAYDVAHGRFVRYQHHPREPNSLTADEVTALIADPQGKVWVGTVAGLNRLDPATRAFTRYAGAGSIDGRVTALVADAAGAIWVGTADGLHRLDAQTATITHFVHSSTDSQSLGDNRIRALAVDRRGRVWIGTDGGGLDRLEVAAGGRNPRERSAHFVHYLHTSDPASIGGNTITALLESADGSMWAGIWGGGLSHLVGERDGSAGRFVTYRRDVGNPRSLASDDVTALRQDRSGALWVGTDGAGVSRFDPAAAARFIHYQHDAGDPGSLSDNRVYAILVDHAANTWVGTWGGVNRLRAGAHAFETVAVGRGSSGERVTALAEARDGAIWVGTLESGLTRIGPGRDEARTFSATGAKGGVSADHVTALFVDHAGDLWVGTAAGLNRLNSVAGGFDVYRGESSRPDTLSSSNIQSLYEDRRQRFWVGTDHGVNVLDRLTGDVIRVSAQFASTEVLQGAITAIAESRDGDIWLAGAEGGVARLHWPEQQAASVRVYAQKEGLPNDRTYGIEPDADGRLWITTDKGIARLDPVSDAIVRFDTSDGLQADEFRGGRFFDARTGRMFLGGINGFNVFRPADIRPSTFSPPVVLTGFTILNQPVAVGDGSPLRTRITEAQEVTLGPDAPVFSVEFAALDFVAPQRLRYAYMLEGFDEGWNYTDASRRFATYTNLGAGRYTLKVKATNRDEVWGAQPISLTLIILPPWWMTWWFRIVTIVVVVAGAIAVHRRRLHVVEVQRRGLEEMVARRTGELRTQKERATRARAAAEQANAAKSLFLANVSHEIRTPLNAVVGLAEALTETRLDQTQRDYVSGLRSAGDTLTELITDILDLAKIEAGRMETSGETFNLEELLETAMRLVRVQAQEKGLQVACDVAADVPHTVRGDKRALNRVLLNLLANAVKFTSEGSVSLFVRRSPKEGTLLFVVRDTGIGIAPESQAGIFDNFTQADASISQRYGGTGLGLAIAKQFVGLMGGTIWVESERGKGSSFAFTATLAAAESASAVPPGASGELPPLRILLVDDAPMNRMVLLAFFRNSPHSVDVAEDAATALEMVARDRYDVVLMDVNMPGVDGHEATRRIRAWEAEQHRSRTPIIALTAHAFAHDIENSLRAGCDAHLTKPVRKAALFDTLRRHAAVTRAIAAARAVPKGEAQRTEAASAPTADKGPVVETLPELLAILPEYVASTREQLDAGLAALESGDLVALRTLGHNLRGSGGSFGLAEVSRLGAELEDAARAGRADLTRRTATAIGSYLATVQFVPERA